MLELKIVVMGSGGVGKSCLTSQFVTNQFNDEYDPTIQDCYRKSLKVGNQEIILEILDTAGTEQFQSFRDLDIQKGDGFLLVYSIIARSTLTDLVEIGDQIHRVKGNSNVPLIIVGNKTDLNERREVTSIEGVHLANRLNCEFIETSAKLSVNVAEVFLKLSQKMVTQHLANLNKPPGKFRDNRNHKNKCTFI